MERNSRDSGIAPGFRRFWWGEAVSGFGGAVTALALQTLVVVNLQGGATQVGWLTSARSLPFLVLGLLVGAFVDRARRRPLMVATDLTRAALLAAIPLAWSFEALTFPLLLVIVTVFGTASLINDAASLSFVPRLVPRTQLQRAHARLDGADAVAQATGPAVAGALIKVLGAPLAVLVNAVTFVFSAVTVATLPSVPEPRPDRTAAERRSLIREIREGVRWVYGRSGLARLAVATHVWFVGQAVLMVVVIPYAYLQLRLSPFQLGVVFATSGVGALVGAAVSTRLGSRWGAGGAIIASHAASAIGVVIMVTSGLAPSGWKAAGVLAVGQLCHGWAMGLSNSHEMSYRQALTPDHLQARTNTTMRSLNRSVFVIVSPLAGLVADRFGYGLALIASALLFVASASILAFSTFRHARVD